MAAQVLKFPNSNPPPKRRGRRPANTVDPRIAARRVQVVAERMDPEGARLMRIALAAIERGKAPRHHEDHNEIFDRWETGEVAVPLQFYVRSRWGIATDHFGEGPCSYRWAVAEALSPPIASNRPDKALALAVEQLNAISLVVRYGGWRVEWDSTEQDEGAREYPTQVMADFGDTMARLVKFGAIAVPDAKEREFITKAQAEHFSAGEDV
ncbi:MAG: hypothetical protein ACREO7_03065 [Pseudoxanthomonas sp.]